MSEVVGGKWRGARLVIAAVAVIAGAACGSDSSPTAEPSTTRPQSTTSPTTASGSPAVVETASNAKLGTILVDSDGMTLYTLTANGTPVACTGACATAWPPLLLPAGTSTASGGTGVTGLGTTSAAGGTQVTHDGAPLYLFSADTAAGVANGDGISSFGGVWHVVKVEDASGTSTSDTTDESSSTTDGGYGY